MWHRWVFGFVKVHRAKMGKKSDKHHDQENHEQDDSPAIGTRNPGTKDSELTQEESKRWSARNAHSAKQPQNSGDRKGPKYIADVRDLLRAIGAHGIPGAEEHQRLIQGMIEHVVERARDTKNAAKAQAKRLHADMFDAGVGHQPLDTCLPHDEQGSDDKGEDTEADYSGMRKPAGGSAADDSQESRDA